MGRRGRRNQQHRSHRTPASRKDKRGRRNFWTLHIVFRRFTAGASFHVCICWRRNVRRTVFLNSTRAQCTCRVPLPECACALKKKQRKRKNVYEFANKVAVAVLFRSRLAADVSKFQPYFTNLTRPVFTFSRHVSRAAGNRERRNYKLSSADICIYIYIYECV